MEIKGLSVKSIPEFVKKNYPERYKEWINALPEESKKIFTDFIKVNEWYPIVAGLTLPIRTVGKVFYENDWKKAVWEMGRFSASEALTGIYKIYVRFGTPRHIIDRAGRVMSAYFSNSEIKVSESTKNRLTFHIVRFDQPDEAIEYNIAGWIERALEISGSKNVKIEITKSLARKDALTEFLITWE
jgi:uncharacterized protein (TIGR02265 family)